MWAYLSRDLEAADSQELEQHLGVCRRCCGELEFSRELRTKVADTGVDRVPPTLRTRLDQLLDETSHREVG